MRTLTALASRTKENASSASPNSSARLGGHAARRDRARTRSLAHQRVDVAVEHVVERRSAAAGEREPGHRGDGEACSGPAASAGDHPAEAGDSSSDMIRGFVSAT